MNEKLKNIKKYVFGSIEETKNLPKIIFIEINNE